MSDDPNDSFIFFKETKITNKILFQCSPRSFSSQFPHRPFTTCPEIKFSFPEKIDFNISYNKSFLFPLKESKFAIEYNNMKNITAMIHNKPGPKGKPKKLGLKETKMQNLDAYFQSGCKYLPYLSSILKMPLPCIKNALKKIRK